MLAPPPPAPPRSPEIQDCSETALRECVKQAEADDGSPDARTSRDELRRWRRGECAVALRGRGVISSRVRESDPVPRPRSPRRLVHVAAPWLAGAVVMTGCRSATTHRWEITPEEIPSGSSAEASSAMARPLATSSTSAPTSEPAPSPTLEAGPPSLRCGSLALLPPSSAPSHGPWEIEHPRECLLAGRIRAVTVAAMSASERPDAPEQTPHSPDRRGLRVELELVDDPRCVILNNLAKAPYRVPQARFFELLGAERLLPELRPGRMVCGQARFEGSAPAAMILGWFGELRDADGSPLMLVTTTRSPPLLGERREASRFRLDRLGIPARLALRDGGSRLDHPRVRVSLAGRSAVSDHGGEARLLADGGALAVWAVSHLTAGPVAVYDRIDDYQLWALRVP